MFAKPLTLDSWMSLSGLMCYVELQVNSMGLVHETHLRERH